MGKVPGVTQGGLADRPRRMGNKQKKLGRDRPGSWFSRGGALSITEMVTISTSIRKGNGIGCYLFGARRNKVNRTAVGAREKKWGRGGTTSLG